MRPAARNPAEQRRWVTPDDLNVAPALLGLPLARPTRRAWVMLIDVTVVAIISSLGNAWLLAALAGVAMAQAWADKRQRAVPWWAWALVAAALAAGVVQAGRDHFATPTTQRALADADDDKAAAYPAAKAASGAQAEQAHLARIAALEAELAVARKPLHWVDQAKTWLDETGLSLGWAIVYFSLLPAWWHGQTLGKRLMGLRVMELTGKPMELMQNLKRYGGYAAGMATGGLGFAQLLWDPNRQALHDKAAHTVVVDLRLPRRATHGLDLPASSAAGPAPPPVN